MGKLTIDGFSFARGGGHLATEIALADCERILDQLAAGQDAMVSVTINGERDSEGACYLDVSVSVLLVLQCQRCLGDLEYDVDIHRRLRLVRSETDIPDDELDDDSIDSIVAKREMSVVDLVEDELLLELPMVATHDNCGLVVS